MEQTLKRKEGIYPETYRGSDLDFTPQVVKAKVKGAKIGNKKDLVQLLKEINAQNLHDGVDWGKREGNETW